MRAGLVTRSSQMITTSPSLTSIQDSGVGHSTSIATVSQAASGTIAAVGGEGAIFGAGGHGGLRSLITADASAKHSETPDSPRIQISLPGMGSYLKLVSGARSHLVSLIAKSASRHIPLYLLREKWDGGISTDDAAAKAKKYRGEFVGVLPTRTRKWKQFYGLSFDWILAECYGAGLIEIFDTGSVGFAVRVT